MKFQINHILNSKNATIKLLSYNHCRLEDLNFSILTKEELNRLYSFKSDKRKLEFYFTRFLWSRFSEFEPITYEGTGKPHIENGHISISHSKKTIAIAYSPIYHIGIDIEHFNPKIKKIAQKFLSTYEIEKFDLNDPPTITTLWSIKEAMYKVLNIPGLIFKEHLKIIQVGTNNKVELNYLKQNKTYPFKRLVFNDFILTYCEQDIILKEIQSSIE